MNISIKCIYQFDRPASNNNGASTTIAAHNRKAINKSDFESKRNKMRAAFSPKCREPRVQPAKEETIDPNDISTDDDGEEDQIGQPIPVQIGNRPGSAKPQYKRQLSIIEANDNESEAGFTG